VTQEAKLVDVYEFIRKIEESSSWAFMWDPGKDRILLRVNGEPEVYTTPDLMEIGDLPFEWFTGKAKKLGILGD
jgi:hypothetical protein